CGTRDVAGPRTCYGTCSRARDGAGRGTQEVSATSPAGLAPARAFVQEGRASSLPFCRMHGTMRSRMPACARRESDVSELDQSRPVTTVATIVIRDGAFLMVEEETRAGVRLNQPAGHLEAGESLVEAAMRETLEESGYHVTPTALVGIYRWQDRKST